MTADAIICNHEVITNYVSGTQNKKKKLFFADCSEHVYLRRDPKTHQEVDKKIR